MIPFVAAFVVFAFAAITMAAALALPTGLGLSPVMAWISLGVGALAGAGAFAHCRLLPANGRRTRLSPWAWAMFTVFALFALREFCWLVYEADDQVYIGSPNNLGDLSLHWQLARFLANGAPWWPAHPEAAGYALRYYPGADGFQALLLLVGVGDYQAFVWTGLAGSAAAVLALYRWGGSFTVAGFLFSGGLWGFQFFERFAFSDYQGTHAWKNLALAIFTTQRPFLFALPAGLLLMAHWREKFFTEPPLAEVPANTPAAHAAALRQPSRGLIPFWVEALLYAVMPFFHVFAFLFLSALLGWWFLCYYPRREMRLHLLALVGVALLPATYEIGLMTHWFHAGGEMMSWKLGWMQDKDGFVASHARGAEPPPPLTPPLFWLFNFGLWAVLAPALWLRCAWVAARAGYASRLRPLPTGGLRLPQLGRAAESAAAFVIPAGAVFVVTCLVKFAPWEWDNTKLMIWTYLAALPFLWQHWVRPLTAPLRWPLCFALFFSGFVSLFGGMGRQHLQYPLIPRAELDGAVVGTRHLPEGARVACAPNYNHPLVYAGFPLAVGYEGHLHSQGIPYQPMMQDLRTLMLGLDGWQSAAARLQVHYVYWGDREERFYPGSTRPWAQDDRVVAAGAEWGAIYELPGR